MSDDWGARLEQRIATLEAALGHLDPEDAELDKMIRKAFRTWMALGWLMKWLVYILAAGAGAITAWNAVLAEALKWRV